MQQQRQHTRAEPLAAGNGQVPVVAARPLPPATLTDVDDAKTHQLVRIVSNYNLRRSYLIRSLSNDRLATILLEHLRHSAEREYLRVLKS
jgi:hypothetical protein